MRYRELGNTGSKVSEIGFGTIPILSGDVPVLPDHYDPSVDEAVEIMMHAYRMGCNLYGTAIPEEYGDAEYKLGVFAEKVGRENIVISDKRTGRGRYERGISPPADFTFDEVIRRLSEHFSPIRCSRCQRCVCPQGHEIHLLLRQYDYYHLGKRSWALKRIRMNIEEVSESCRRCTERLCMKDCPQKLMIPELIERIRELTL